MGTVRIWIVVAAFRKFFAFVDSARAPFKVVTSKLFPVKFFGRPFGTTIPAFVRHALLVVVFFAAILALPREAASGQLFGPSSSGFVRVKPATGAATVVNPTAPSGVECCGSRTFDPATQTMYYLSGSSGITAVNTTTGSTRAITVTPAADAPNPFVFDPGTASPLSR